MKRVLLLLLMLAMLFAFASCKNDEQPDRHFRDPTEDVTDTEGEGDATTTEPVPDDSENIVETPKVPFEDIVQSGK